MRNPIVRPPHLLLGPLALCLLLVGLAGCASNISYRHAEFESESGQWDEAVLDYMKALERDPQNITYRVSLLRAKIKASQMHFQRGQGFEKAKVLDRALVEYEQAVQLDTTNQYAQAQLEHVRQAVLSQHGDADTIDQIKQKARAARPQPPILNPRSTQPISLDFPEPVSIFQIYRALGKAFGINILFDPNLKDQEIAVSLKDVTAQAALETLMRAGTHFYKVIDEHTIIIAADNQVNRRNYEDLVIQTFFLSNAEVKEMSTILRSLMEARRLAVNERLNAIIMRDSADKVKVAERIIEANDKARAEVVVDIELLQINTTRMRELGVQLSSYSIGQQLDVSGGASSTTAGGTTGTATTTSNGVHLSDLQGLNQSNWLLTLPSFVYNFIKQSGDAQLLAKPQLRITEGEKATLIIGDKRPIPLTTFNTQTAVNGGIVPITSFQYQDVGITINLEPRVHHNREVTLKVKVEVSNFGGNITGPGGQEQPIISTRTIDSVIRLRDGETNFMAGLLRTDDSNTDTGIPGLSDIPLLGRLFSDKKNDHARTDVILTLTPHIIRNAEITQEDLLPIWVGTESNVTFRGSSPRVESENEGPFEGNEGTPEEIQDAIRRRIQRLPRGLRPDGTADNPAAPNAPAVPAPGVNLVPSTAPSSIFNRPTTPTAAPNVPPPVAVQPQAQPAPAEGDDAPPGPPTQGALLERSLGRMERAATNGMTGSIALAAYRPASVDEAADASVTSDTAVTSAAAPARRASPVVVSLAADKKQVAPGGTFTVLVQVSATQPVSHLPLSLHFDPAVVAVESVAAGDFLGGAGEAQLLSDFSHRGELTLGASRLGAVAGVRGSGIVARVTFRALAAGATRLALFGSKALDNALHPLRLDLQPLNVQVRRQPAATRGAALRTPPVAMPTSAPAVRPARLEA